MSVRAAYNAIRALEKHWSYSFEPTVHGFASGKKHHLDESKQITSVSGEKLAYDPEIILPYVIGGGPFRSNASWGRLASYGVVFSVSAFWLCAFAYCMFESIARSL